MQQGRHPARARRRLATVDGQDFAASAAQRRAWAEVAHASIRRELGDGAVPIAAVDSSLPDGCIDSALNSLAVETTLIAMAAQRR